MNNDEHIKLVELINFSKGIYGKPGEEVGDEMEYERIVLHLGNCSACMSYLMDIEYIKSHFDEVWDKIFPVAAETDPSSEAKLSILIWIRDIKEILNKEAKLIISNIENSLQAEYLSITGQLIPAINTTHGISETDQKTLYFLNPEDVELFDKIELKDNNLILHSISDPGYRNVMIIGPGSFYRKTDIREFGPDDFYARFSNIELVSERYLIHFE